MAQTSMPIQSSYGKATYVRDRFYHVKGQKPLKTTASSRILHSNRWSARYQPPELQESYPGTGPGLTLSATPSSPLTRSVLSSCEDQVRQFRRATSGGDSSSDAALIAFREACSSSFMPMLSDLGTCPGVQVRVTASHLEATGGTAGRSVIRSPPIESSRAS